MEKEALTSLNVSISKFCQKIQKSIENLQPCLVRFNYTCNYIKVYITFNHEMCHPLKEVIRLLNEELEKTLLGDGWDKFYIRQNKLSNYGNFSNERECISLNLYRLNAFLE